MTTMTRRQAATLFGAAALAGAVGLDARLKPARAASGTLAKIKARGKLIAGIANEQPYGFIDPAGKLTGANIDVLRAIMAPLGVTEIEAPIVDFGALVPGLAADRFDVIGAGLFIRPARCKVIGFSNPVTRSGGAFAVKAGNPLKLHSLKDVAANKEARFGTQTGSNQVQEAKDAGIQASQISLFDKDNEALAALQAGRLDVIYFPDVEIAGLVKAANDSGVERALPFEQMPGPDGKPFYNYHAYGLPKGDEEFAAAFNGELAKLRQSGRLLELLKPYGYTENELPPLDATAAQACAG
ncbi:ectoine/hydroxyectoine ABC transporter substrate-binding protein EhuB [Lichenihabitans sp. Uapishka_5]|uniref:ectoine/hydroxyectoine ABC transporter substrate-binding protein EhuB n=1 Tax=Lichenihabitans sp. Uapishka_5 TaxID=3037302 RepID=UPI0029E7F420|nr:ectoine/hydroxyectoine ABC transporter substrate-binding protein EhuB [Lichenihabitans sp. Uapishka_5]MDX7950335.1 ectoine/hydroxyectoine ABC transporter substrate-binding protein EhuB [Lichenihabitans sp. Uapishka_5]